MVMKTYVAESVTNFSGSAAAIPLQLESVGVMGRSDRRYVCQTDSPCRNSSPMWTGTRVANVSAIALVLAADCGAAVVQFVSRSMTSQWI